MTDIVLEHLKRIQSDISDIKRALREIKTRRATVRKTPKHSPEEIFTRLLKSRKSRRLPKGETIRAMIDHGRA